MFEKIIGTREMNKMEKIICRLEAFLKISAITVGIKGYTLINIDKKASDLLLIIGILELLGVVVLGMSEYTLVNYYNRKQIQKLHRTKN